MQGLRPRLKVISPFGQAFDIEIIGDQLAIGRDADVNAVALTPDPQQLVTRSRHCLIIRDDGEWWVADNASRNGTILDHDGAAMLVEGRQRLTDGDVIRILGLFDEDRGAQYWRLEFHDPARTQAGPFVAARPCLAYDWVASTAARVDCGRRTPIERLRAQEHKLLRYMAQQNRAAGGPAVLCPYSDLIEAVWGDEPGHTREELNHLVWELRRKVESDPANPVLLRTERALGYRLHTCREGA